MNKIVFTALAVLLATGSAFAGSDHFSANAGQQAAAFDTTTTASIATPDMAGHDMQPVARIAADEPGRGIWGH
ncbi:DUF680 domain-containing protein [Mesorhizobium sp. RCC_202]|uniref:DUF680 domain-containing protein n=1 Tax=Mesorhizobium sp. RCC_202 TaxID=3239222 RepID=UPI0035256568